MSRLTGIRIRSFLASNTRAHGLLPFWASPLALVLGLGVLGLGACANPTSTPEEGSKEEVAQGTVDGKADSFTFDPCERHGWYEDGACDWFCFEPDPDCAAAPIGPEPAGQVTSYPFVIHHGFAGGVAGPFAYTNVEETLEADGHAVYSTAVPPFDGIAVRVEYLRETVDRALMETGAQKVNIIAHSMGGLDSRYLISTLGYGDRVASLTTISTPHLGTAVADFGLSLSPGASDPVINGLARLLGSKISEANDSIDVRTALTDLSEAASVAFNEANTDDARVYYQSWAGVSSTLGLASTRERPSVVEACQGVLHIHEGTFDRLNPIFPILAPVIAHGLIDPDPHDGLVTVDSARWGDFRGCIPADHSEEVGVYSGGSEGPNNETGFDHLRFYRNVAYELASMGY